MGVESSYFEWWYVVIAGLHEYADHGYSIDTLPEEYLRAALAIDCLHPTFAHEGNVTREIEHNWKIEFLQKRPQSAVVAYLALARAYLAKKAEHVHGLHELLHLYALKPFSQWVAISLLEEFPTAPSQVLRQLLPFTLRSEDANKPLETVRRGLIKSRSENDEDAHSLWAATGNLLSPTEFRNEIESLNESAVRKAIWALRDTSGFRRGVMPEHALSLEQLKFIVQLTGRHFARASPPSNGWTGDTNPWGATDFILQLISVLSASPTEDATEALSVLAQDSAMESYRDDIKHAIAQQRIRRIDAQFQQPSWREAVGALMNGAPAGIADLHALVLAHLADLGPHIASGNTDIYKRFWNEGRYNRIDRPKGEESCRDVLVDLLRARLDPHGVAVEPEGHMATDKRADIVAILPKMKLVIELKRDHHQDVWKAARDQLDRFYTRDPEAQGFGIYGVFWYGEKRGSTIPCPPAPLTMPQSATVMQQQLQSLIPSEKSNKLRVVVIDVSEPTP